MGLVDMPVTAILPDSFKRLVHVYVQFTFPCRKESSETMPLGRANERAYANLLAPCAKSLKETPINKGTGGHCATLGQA
jgi:hypothetical protein